MMRNLLLAVGLVLMASGAQAFSYRLHATFLGGFHLFTTLRRFALKNPRRSTARRSLQFATAVAITISGTSALATTIAGYTLIETINVPADGSIVMSSTSLTADEVYKLRAIGTAPIASGGYSVDAEYFNGSSDYCVYGGVSACDYGIGVNDTSVGGLKNPFWGAMNSLHEYTIDFLGTGDQLTFRLHDDGYGDNSGFIAVEIHAVPEPSTALLLSIGLVGMAARRRV